MRITQVVPYFYPAWAYGGPAKLVYDLARYLGSQGHQVLVLTSDSYDEKKRMPEELRIARTENLQIRYYRNIQNTLAYRFNIFFTPGFYVPAVRAILHSDVVHIHDFYTPQNTWVSFLCWLFNKPLLISVHGCLEPKRLEQRSLFKRFYLKIVGSWMLKKASMLIATSDNELEAYASQGITKNRIYRMGHGVDTDEYKPRLGKKSARKQLGVPLDKTIISYLGRVHSIKGLDLLVAAVDLLKEKQIHVIIAGSDDGYKTQLIADIRSRKLESMITLMDTCFGQEKELLFAATDLFVYPSYSEGFSLGILEAAASGLPLLISTGCHFPEAEKEKAGSVVEPNPQAFAEAITQLISKPGLLSKMGKRARLLILQHYSFEVAYKKLEKLYSDLSKGIHNTNAE